MSTCPVDCIPQITLGIPISSSTTGLDPHTTRSTCGGISDGTGGAKQYELKRASGLVTLDLCSETSFDSQIRVYKKNGDCVAGNDDFCGLQSLVTFTAHVSETYNVWIQ